MPDQDCPKEEEFRDWLAGRMPVEAAERLFAHLDSCPRCQAKLQTVRDVGDTLIDCLRQPWVRDELQDEPEFREAVARTKLIGDAPPTCDLAGRKGEPKSEILGELGEYQILEKLARGGMGTVYKALHTKLGREVALKVLPAGGLGSEEAIARFEREMKAVGQLDHPHIVRALDARKVGGTRFLVLEYIDGEDLSRLVRRRGPLTVAEACRLVRQAAVGLQYAHEHKLIHRDVKPSNLMRDRQGQLKILDLGLARFRLAEPAGEEMTRSGETMGTIEYMAPEQASDTHSVDVRADIYGLGCTLHYLLIGRAPYAGETAYQTLKAHHESPIPSLRAERSDVPENLDRVFQKMVAKTPAERQASMSEVIADLDACLAQAEEFEGTAESSEPPSLSSRPKWSMRRVVLVAAALALPLLLAGLVLRLMTPQGMLVLRVDQQEADVAIDDGKITITKPFAISRHEVTRGQFRTFVHETGYETEAERHGQGGYGLVDGKWKRDPRFIWSADPGFPQTDDHPVVNISWNDAVAFCHWLSQKKGAEYHLPTEAQWEYACRAGTTAAWHCGQSDATLEEYAWFTANAADKTHPVGQLKPNPWTLYDTHGNVWEWCADRYGSDYYGQSPSDDPVGSSAGPLRVARGGCWALPARICRAAYRDDNTPLGHNYDLGFRLAAVLVDKSSRSEGAQPKSSPGQVQARE